MTLRRRYIKNEGEFIKWICISRRFKLIKKLYNMIQVGIGSKFKYNGKKWVVINIENKMYTFTTLDKKEKMTVTAEEMAKISN